MRWRRKKRRYPIFNSPKDALLIHAAIGVADESNVTWVKTVKDVLPRRESVTVNMPIQIEGVTIGVQIDVHFNPEERYKKFHTIPPRIILNAVLEPLDRPVTVSQVKDAISSLQQVHKDLQP